MKPLRLVLVTRQFWPLVGGAERVMSHLAAGLRQLGAETTILTAQWEKSWPTTCVHRDVPVVRLPQPRKRGWGTFRYMRSLSRWLQEHQDEIDLVFVSMLKHDAYAALSCVDRTRVPVVLRAEGGGPTGDCYWQNTNRFGQRIKRRCLTADALVAPSEAIAAELCDNGYAADRVNCVTNGVAIPSEPQDARNKARSRAALAEAHPILQIPENSPLVVYTGRLHEGKGLDELVKAWPAVQQKWPGARLWLIGEGPHVDKLWKLISRLELKDQVILPGSFDEIDEVLYAADLFVLPSYEEATSLSLAEAMAAGLPVVASDIPGLKMLVTHNEHGLLVPPRDVASLQNAMLQLLQNTDDAGRLGRAARQRVIEGFSLEHMVRGHLAVFEREIANKTGRAPREQSAHSGSGE